MKQYFVYTASQLNRIARVFESLS